MLPQADKTNNSLLTVITQLDVVTDLIDRMMLLQLIIEIPDASVNKFQCSKADLALRWTSRKARSLWTE